MNRVTLRTSNCFSMIGIVLIFGSVASAQQTGSSFSPQQAEEQRIAREEERRVRLAEERKVAAVNYVQRNGALLQPLSSTLRLTRPSLAEIMRTKQLPKSNVVIEISQQMFLLEGLAPAALAAGDDQQAQKYARDLAALADKLKSEFPGEAEGSVARAIHKSNIILGLVALKAGETNQAKEHLLAAGRITAPESSQKTFGPDMLLAKQLLEKGERDTVLQYFELCAAFWELGQEKLGQWKEAVGRGETPEFGGNVGVVTELWRFDQR